MGIRMIDDGLQAPQKRGACKRIFGWSLRRDSIPSGGAAIVSRKGSLNRNAKAYQRGKPRTVASGKMILIVTEGKKTEPNYLKALRKRFQLAAADIEIVHPDGTDPITLNGLVNPNIRVNSCSFAVQKLPMSRIEELLKEVVRGNQLMFRIFISGVQKELVGDDSPFNNISCRHLLRIMRIKSF